MSSPESKYPLLIDAKREAAAYLRPDIPEKERERRITEMTRRAIERVTRTPTLIDPNQTTGENHE